MALVFLTHKAQWELLLPPSQHASFHVLDGIVLGGKTSKSNQRYHDSLLLSSFHQTQTYFDFGPIVTSNARFQGSSVMGCLLGGRVARRKWGTSFHPYLLSSPITPVFESSTEGVLFPVNTKKQNVFTSQDARIE